jgi:alpha-tubulin suppressor-like RCC1 family protein
MWILSHHNSMQYQNRNSNCLENEKLFCIGDNQFGQLGTGDNKSTKVPIELNFFKNENLKEIVCVENYCFAICGIHHSFNYKENKVFSWGRNSYYGLFGHGDTNDRFIPTQVDFFDGKKIIQIACGNNHCLALEGNLNLFESPREWKYLFLGKE